MKIKFKETAELELVVNFDEKTETGQFETETFKAGDIEEVDTVSINFDLGTVDIQFGDGSVAFGVPRHLFEVIESDNSPFAESEEFHQSCS